MANIGKLEFCRHWVYLDGKLITFGHRPYLPAIYASTWPNLVLRCSRQVEKTTFLANTILYEACVHPGIAMLYVAPRVEQARTFCRTKLLPCLERSPLIRRQLTGRSNCRMPLMNMQFINGSQLFVRAAYHDADNCRGLSVQRLYIDEYQDVAPKNLAVLKEAMSHAQDARMILTGTPKLLENPLEGAFSASTANEWTISCAECGKEVILDERCLGPRGIICPDCQHPIDPQQGRWIPRNPQSTWGDGYWIGHPMVPWMNNYDKILARQSEYEPARFKNECLGLPTSLGDHVVTREELERCCEDRPMAKSLTDVPASYRNCIIAGLDWGGGGVSRTVLVLGFMREDYTFEIFHMERFPAQEDPNQILVEVASRLEKFHVHAIGVDGGGNGFVYNRLLVDKLRATHPHLYAILYSDSGQAPSRDGVLWKWTVGRSQSIGAVFGRIKKRTLLFPNAQESGSFLDEFAGELFEYDDDQRSGRYTHPETVQDDALHATNYALVVAVRAFQGQRRSM